MTENNRDFKGVWIPKEVWLDTRLNALDKIILAEIDSLDMGEDGCWASNKYIADFCQCSETKVSTAISNLIAYGYLYVKSFDGRLRVLKSRLSNFERQTLKKCEADFQKLKQSNTKNKTNNKTKKKDIGEKRKRFVPPTLDEVKAYCLERKNNVDPQKFFDYFNASDWYDSKGNKVKSWKQKVITWEGYSKKEKSNKGLGNSFDTDEFFEVALARSWSEKEQPKTAADDPDIREKGNALKERLGIGI